MKLNNQYHELLSELVQCARALGEYRKDIVVTGGLVPLLYRFHPNFDRPRQSALLTGDVDLTVPKPLPIRGEITLRERLDSNSQFSNSIDFLGA